MRDVLPGFSRRPIVEFGNFFVGFESRTVEWQRLAAWCPRVRVRVNIFDIHAFFLFFATGRCSPVMEPPLGEQTQESYMESDSRLAPDRRCGGVVK